MHLLYGGCLDLGIGSSLLGLDKRLLQFSCIRLCLLHSAAVAIISTQQQDMLTLTAACKPGYHANAPIMHLARCSEHHGCVSIQSKRTRLVTAQARLACMKLAGLAPPPARWPASSHASNSPQLRGALCRVQRDGGLTHAPLLLRQRAQVVTQLPLQASNLLAQPGPVPYEVCLCVGCQSSSCLQLACSADPAAVPAQVCEKAFELLALRNADLGCNRAEKIVQRSGGEKGGNDGHRLKVGRSPCTAATNLF